MGASQQILASYSADAAPSPPSITNALALFATWKIKADYAGSWIDAFGDSGEDVIPFTGNGLGDWSAIVPAVGTNPIVGTIFDQLGNANLSSLIA